MVRGQRKDIGLGGLSAKSLAEARHEATALRARARNGEDVLEKRRLEKKKTNTPRFEEAARIVHRKVAPTLKNDLNRENWLRSLENHVFDLFGNKPVDGIDSGSAASHRPDLDEDSGYGKKDPVAYPEGNGLGDCSGFPKCFGR